MKASSDRIGPAAPPRSHRVRRAIVALAMTSILAVASLVYLVPPAPHALSLTELQQVIAAGEVQRLAIDGERISVWTADGLEHEAVVGDDAVRSDIVSAALANHVAIEYQAGTMSAHHRAYGWAFGLVALVVGGAVVTRQLRARGTSHFDVRTPGAGPGFERVAGLTEAKRALQETICFLRSPGQFEKLGGRPPRGILLTGEPGTGKTMLARAAAEEAGVDFLTCSGGSFQEMFVGVGASRVRKLFAEAKRRAPCIVFIDEIDSIGKKRSTGGDGASAEHDQTLNQLLVAMDGFDVMQGIVVIATTNRADVLDAALVRPGRFDRHVYVSLPSRKERLAILEVHAQNKPLVDVDLDALAGSAGGLSGAELSNVLNEAAIMAAREDSSSIFKEHVDEALDRVLMGASRPGLLTDARERYIAAVHEAGHAVVAMTAPCCDHVHKVSVLPRERSLGVTIALPERDRLMLTREDLEDRICMLLGGRAAELEILGTSTAGAADDIERATEIAKQMVTQLGMSELGCLALSSDGGSAAAIEQETRRLLTIQLDRAAMIVRSRRGAMDKLVEQLLVHDTVERAAVARIMPKLSDDSCAFEVAASPSN